MTDADLVARLASHRTLGSAPRQQLEWLAAHATFLRFEAGEVVSKMSEPLRRLIVVLSGHLCIRVDRGASPRMVMEWHGGDVTGLLPYSRLSSPPGDTTTEAPTEILDVSSEHFPEMAARCHELTAILVHVMLDRARRFTTSDLHDEKMISLGRLAAGLAHELNNPASALDRNSRELSAGLFELEASALALGSLRLTPDRLAVIERVRKQCDEHGARAALTPLERADREEAVAAWLAGRGLRADIGEGLSGSPLTVRHLEELAAALDGDALDLVLRAICSSHRTRLLASEVEVAARRIHSLVAAIRGFTYMDQTRVPSPVDIGQGLSDTMAVLGAKARERSVTVSIRIDDGLPPVEGFGGELNQVWANLIDNAIDAAPDSGRVEVTAARRGGSVIVQVVDDGPGIAPERLAQIFEPFFTTKPPGKGTGLGLDIVRRLVRQHDGQIEVESRPGRTEFRVVLPGA